MSRPAPTMTKEMMEEQGLALYVRAEKFGKGRAGCEIAVNASAKEAIDMAAQILVNIVCETAMEDGEVHPLKLLTNMMAMKNALDQSVENMAKDGLAELKAKRDAEQMLKDTARPATVH